MIKNYEKLITDEDNKDDNSNNNDNNIDDNITVYNSNSIILQCSYNDEKIYSTTIPSNRRLYITIPAVTVSSSSGRTCCNDNENYTK